MDVMGNRLLEAIKPLDGETPIAEDDLQMRVFVDNVERPARCHLPNRP